MTESKCLSMGYVSFIQAGSPSGGEAEAILSTQKKVTGPDGEMYPYISGQAIRRMLRDRLDDQGFEISPLQAGYESERTGKSVAVSSGDPESFIDDDLFGYMIARGERAEEASRKRTGPVRVGPCVALHPYKFDVEFGVRRGKEEEGIWHNPFETEVVRNYFVGSILVELDRIGEFTGMDLGGDEEKSLDTEIRKERLLGLIRAIQFMWGGGRQGRLLVDMSPVFIAYARQSIKNPIFLNSLYIDEAGNFDLDLLEEAPLEDEVIKKIAFGLQNRPIANADELLEKQDFYPLNDAFDVIKGDVKGLSFE